MSGGIWLDNWRGLRNSALVGGGYSSASATNTQAYDYSGRTTFAGSAPLPTPLASSIYRGTGTSSGSITVRFGQSDTTPTAADYNLGDPVMSNLTYVSAVASDLTWSGSTASRTYTVTVQNTANAAVVFREYGIFAESWYRSSGTSNNITACMVYREVLDTPVTLAQYETATITFTVSLTLGDPVPGVS